MINRRDFAKLAAIAAAAAVLPPFIPKIDIEDNMQLSAILLKIADNKPLTPQERESLRLMAEETQQRNAQLGGMTAPDGNLHLKTPYAEDMNFGVIPLGSVAYNGLGLGQQSIPNDTQTIIGNSLASQTNISTNKFFRISDDSKKLYIEKVTYRIILYGDMTWNNNATGYRALRKYAYRADGTEISYDVLARAQAVTTGATTYSWICSQRIYGVMQPGDYISFKAYQNSGGALDLNEFSFGAFAVA